MTVKEWLAEKDIKFFINRIQEAIKSPKVNPRTGEINFQYDPKNIDEDYYFVTRAEPKDDSVTFKSEQQ